MADRFPKPSPGAHVRRLALAAILAMTLGAAMAAGDAQPAAPPISAAQLAALQLLLNRAGTAQLLDHGVTDALGLTSPGGPPLTVRELSVVDEGGVGYGWAPLPDGRHLLVRRERDTTIHHLFVVNARFQLERAMLRRDPLVPVPVPPEQAQAELRGLLETLRQLAAEGVHQ